MENEFRALSLDAETKTHQQVSKAGDFHTSESSDKHTAAAHGPRRRKRDTRLDPLSKPAEPTSADSFASNSADHPPAQDSGAVQNEDVSHTAASRQRGRGRGKKQSSNRNHQNTVAPGQSADTALPAAVHPSDSSARNENETSSGAALAASETTLKVKSKSRRRRRDPRGAKPAEEVASAAAGGCTEPTWTTYGETVGRVGMVAPEVQSLLVILLISLISWQSLMSAG